MNGVIKNTLGLKVKNNELQIKEALEIAYEQGKVDAPEAEVLDDFAKWCRENDIQCRKKIDGHLIEFSVSEIVNSFKRVKGA